MLFTKIYNNVNEEVNEEVNDKVNNVKGVVCNAVSMVMDNVKQGTVKEAVNDSHQIH
ncbi:hypothetical protein EZS27_034547 [termite gut metagenome]|uniref:Uncharacterized protein n=1 Tax=termite gut metagenome TaxID=433724 RepID=A0A5J4Q1Q6_9ZZZZ